METREEEESEESITEAKTEPESDQAPAQPDDVDDTGLDYEAIVRRLPPEPGSVHDWDNLQRRGFVDLDKVACLLCKRALPSLEKLEKHARVSALHIESVRKARLSLLDILT